MMKLILNSMLVVVSIAVYGQCIPAYNSAPSTIVKPSTTRPAGSEIISAYIPNNKGNNEKWLPIGVNIDPNDFKLYIFNRWGEMIHEIFNLQQGWDGTYQKSGDPVQDGVYVYKLEVKDNEGIHHKYIGHITLLS